MNLTNLMISPTKFNNLSKSRFIQKAWLYLRKLIDWETLPFCSITMWHFVYIILILLDNNLHFKHFSFKTLRIRNKNKAKKGKKEPPSVKPRNKNQNAQYFRRMKEILFINIFLLKMAIKSCLYRSF